MTWERCCLGLPAIVVSVADNQKGTSEDGGKCGFQIYLGDSKEVTSLNLQAALETLSVIAYKQPIARGQIASIRGVNVDSVVRTLTSRGLVTELYTDSETGAIHYGTTSLLLEQLGINSLDQLPPISPYLPDINSDFNER